MPALEEIENRTNTWIKKIEQNKLLLCIRQGMVLSLPVVITGSFALLLTSFPIPAYREFLESLWNGRLYAGLTQLQNATNGIISLVFLLTISYSYERVHRQHARGLFPLVSLCCYIVFLIEPDGFSVSRFNSQWIFYAVSVSVLSAVLFEQLDDHFFKNRRTEYLADNSLFAILIPSVPPFVMTVVTFSIAGGVLGAITENDDFASTFSELVVGLFDGLGRGLPSALLFVLLLNLFWFFGIHGGMMLDLVAQEIFIPGIQVNITALEAGQLPTEIVSKTFLDTFVMFGGCGSVLCLVITLFLFERRKPILSLAKIAATPVLFNINELIVFGMPLVLNPLYFIPFICTPILLTLTSYGATALGWVPYAVNRVEWTTPIFLSGYTATGSIAGSILQLVNLVLGVGAYVPFVLFSQRRHKNNLRQEISKLTAFVKEGEVVGSLPHLLEDERTNNIAQVLAGDLDVALKSGGLKLFYQPQVNEHGELVGAEALLRWEYQPGFFLYPPLVVTLVEERGLGIPLAEWIIETVSADMAHWRDDLGIVLPISFNITPSQLRSGRISEIILNCRHRFKISRGLLGVEVTEQMALTVTEDVERCFQDLRDTGALILIDDFGMGHSTMMHLQNSQFDVVKLDGSLTRQVLTNSRSSDIISSIVFLSKFLQFDVCAEFVETEEQKERLREIGCYKYQGYLYSPALPVDKFVEYCAEMVPMIQKDREKS